MARCAALTEDDLATKVSTYIEQRGSPIVDGEMTIAELLVAQVNFHYVLHSKRSGHYPVRTAVSERPRSEPVSRLVP